MDIFYETYKIIKNDKELREWIKKNGKEAYKILRWKYFKSKLSIKEKTDNELVIFEQLIANKEFEQKFTDKFAYLKFILANIMLSVNFKNKGLLLSKFFINNRILYFPRYIPFINYKTKIEIVGKYIKSLHFETDGEISEEYKFYGINNESIDINYLNNKLTKINLKPNNKTEEKNFLEFLKTKNIQYEMYFYLRYNNKTNTFYLDNDEKSLFGDEKKEKTVLTFINKKENILSTANELKTYLEDNSV